MALKHTNNVQPFSQEKKQMCCRQGVGGSRHPHIAGGNVGSSDLCGESFGNVHLIRKACPLIQQFHFWEHWHFFVIAKIEK